MQQTLGIQRETDTADLVYQTDRTSLPHQQTPYLHEGSFAVPEYPGGSLQREELQRYWSSQVLWCQLSPPCCQGERGDKQAHLFSLAFITP